MNKKEGVRRTAVVLRAAGWIVVALSVLIGLKTDIGNAFVVLLIAGLLFGAAYIVDGFASSKEQ